TVTLVYKITAANKKKKTTDKVTVTIKNKKIAKVTKKPLTIGKLTITVKGLKKGKTTLTVKVGKKSVKTTIQVKK
ncbi:MAG: Ig-like domain-containing protein, partial [Lachnospiraceae bacterium]|nr:Ig-like domain-containing protein [Lachnospiraceae bacterium]